jgi:hypothetical protein
MKTFFAILLLPFTFSYLLCFISVLGLIFQNWFIFDFFVYGILAYILAFAVLLRRRFAFWLTFEHEFTHIIFAVIMFKPVYAMFVVDGMGGETFIGKKVNFLILLAPYFFPTFPLLALLLKPVIQPIYFKYYLFVIGFLMGYHFISSFKESKPFQPDIKQAGLFFSSIFILLMHAIFISGIILILLDGWTSFWLFLQDGFWQTVEFFGWAIRAARGQWFRPPAGAA